MTATRVLTDQTRQFDFPLTTPLRSLGGERLMTRIDPIADL